VENRRSPPSVWALPLGEAQPGESLQRWLYRSLRDAIVEGRLGPGAVLPGSRALAAQYTLARGTVQAAYDQLIAEGYLQTRSSSGTIVSPNLPDRSLRAAASVTAVSAPWAPPLAPQGLVALLGNAGAAFPLQQPSGPSPAFHPHQCDVSGFPYDAWRNLYMRHLRQTRPDTFSDTGPGGLPRLRREISSYLHIARGVDVPPEQIVITGSVQQCLDLCTRLLVGTGEAVWMEDPGYPGARQLFRACGVRVIDVPVDEDGIRVEEGIQLAAHARLAYVTPARQCPLSVALSPQRRLSLLDWARSVGAYVFEDDYDSQYRFGEKPIPALRSHPGSEQHVILAGTFSKMLFPGIRLAFVALPRHLVDSFVRAFSLTARSANGLSQAVLADFMAEGLFDRHVRRMRRLYAARAATLVEAAERHWRGLLELKPPTAGLDLVARLVGMDEAEAVARLEAAGLAAFPLQSYCGGRPLWPGLVMGFAPFDEAAINSAAERLASVLRS
jgi:GntR family transcriptional regulator/MocR family aminotransferase